MTAHNLFDHLGRPIALGPKLGGGGEGTVYHVAGFPDLAAKVYDIPGKAPPRDQEAKVRAMIGLTRKELANVAAWPTAALYEQPGGPFRGLLMRKIKDAKEIHFLYSPSHRKVTFPEADWRFLVHTAMNCAAAFDTVHSCGVVIGDVNQGNVFVSAQGLVALIDCDSYNVRFNGQNYLCSEVGIDLFTPPELQGRSFRGVERTPNHDCFGLAVLVFYLLFMNRHPFAGRYLGHGEMPIDQAISQYRFAYSRSARTYQMQTPPKALSLSAVPTELVELFERAFGQGSAQANARPKAAEWQSALKNLLGSLRTCTSDPGHVYAAHLPNCPWHGLMQQGAPNLFSTVAYVRAASLPGGVSFVPSAVWIRIERIPRPIGIYVRPAMPPSPTPVPWPAGLWRSVPPKPMVPSILTSPPGPPVAFNSGLQAPPKPTAPAILTSPPAPPAVLGLTSPPKPTPPTILTSPPPAPAMIAPPTKHEKKTLQPQMLQKTVGIGSLVCFAGFIPLGACAGLLGVAIYGPVGLRAVFLGVVGFLPFLFLGACWLILEWMRRRQEFILNHEYEEELAELRAEARRKRTVWEKQLRAKQDAARQAYKEEVACWKQLAATLAAEARRRQEQWNAQIAAQQAEARPKYEEEVARWQKIVATVAAEVRRRQAVWKTQLAAQQTEARQRYEEDVRHWEKAVAALNNEIECRRRAASVAEQRAVAAEQNWAMVAAKLTAEFDSKKAELRRLLDRHNELAGEYATARQKLQSRAEEMQRTQFLQQKFISDDRIPMIGPGRLATLSSYGIETAFDIVQERILEVPGFGGELTERLVQWRIRITSQFVFDVVAGIPPHEQQALESKFAKGRQVMEAAVLSGERELQDLATRAEGELRQSHENIKSSFCQVAQAKSDLAVVPPALAAAPPHRI